MFLPDGEKIEKILIGREGRIEMISALVQNLLIGKS